MMGPLQNPKNIFKRIIGFCHAFLAILTLFPMLLLFNIIQILTLIIKPFSYKVFRFVNRFLANTWWSTCVHWAHVIKIKVTYSGDQIPDGENAIIVANHQSIADVPVLMDFAHTKKRLADIKCFIKDIVKYIPGPGIGMKILEFPFVKRKWIADKAHVYNSLKNIIKNKTPFWMIIFAEGTRLNERNLKSSQDYAKKMGIVPFQNVLYPRTKGFVSTVDVLRPEIKAIYDVTIGYDKGVPSLLQLAQLFSKLIKVHVKRFPVHEIPVEKNAIEAWLLQRFRVKDALLETLYKTGQYLEEPQLKMAASH